ncbi:unnamed protein product [Brassicogethes aeneus]|uniref:Uncharacterized protein n=1 Tax=Brassicogethes aeneus TaxID=1431903 RepID=A0A9P0AZZ9_BRAAE|nr:unnamed protein product [Brassicogethes aeneus]
MENKKDLKEIFNMTLHDDDLSNEPIETCIARIRQQLFNFENDINAKELENQSKYKETLRKYGVKFDLKDVKNMDKPDDKGEKTCLQAKADKVTENTDLEISDSEISDTETFDSQSDY